MTALLVLLALYAGYRIALWMGGPVMRFTFVLGWFAGILSLAAGFLVIDLIRLQVAAWTGVGLGVVLGFALAAHNLSSAFAMARRTRDEHRSLWQKIIQ